MLSHEKTSQLWWPCWSRKAKRDFEFNSDSCDSFVLGKFTFYHASFVVQCTGGNKKRLTSPNRQSDGRMNFRHAQGRNFGLNIGGLNGELF